jgi:hypothetical protein
MGKYIRGFGLLERRKFETWNVLGDEKTWN